MSVKVNMHILVVDDDAYKVEDIKRIWLDAGGGEWSSFNVVNSIADALKHIQKHSVDLLILDLNIPWREGQVPNSSEARRLLAEIYDDIDILPPKTGIILSSYDDIISQERDYFLSKGWVSLKYSADSDEWRSALKYRLEYLHKSCSCSTRLHDELYRFDYCILTALRSPELDPVLKWSCEWKATDSLDSSPFFTGFIEVAGIKRSIVAGSAFRMGSVHASILCAKAWHYFRPKNIIMVGIAAGVKGAVKLGDVLIAEEVWDYAAGKIAENAKGERIFRPDPRHVNADHPLVEGLWAFGQNKAVLSAIEEEWPLKKANVLSVHKGPIASGSAVISNATEINSIVENNRKLIGLEMESYGVYSTCEILPKPRPRFICVKGVCDFADGGKDDSCQEYASFTSSYFVKLSLEAGLFEAF